MNSYNADTMHINTAQDAAADGIQFYGCDEYRRDQGIFPA